MGNMPFPLLVETLQTILCPEEDTQSEENENQ